MGRQATPEQIRQFQQDAELLLSNGWNVTMIAEKMEVNHPSNLGGNINFREAVDKNKRIGKKPGGDIINKFYVHFRLEIERLKPIPPRPSEEIRSEFNQEDGGQRRIRELEESKKFLEQQLAAVISNNTTLSNSIDSLADNYTDLAKNSNDLSKAYVELALRGKPGDGAAE